MTETQMSIDEIYYKNLLDKLYDGICCVDRNRTIIYWNKAAEKISGFSSAEAVGKNCCDDLLLHTDKRGKNLSEKACPIAQTLLDGIPREGDYFIRHKDGTRTPVTSRIELLIDQHGGNLGAVTIFHDNSSRQANRTVIESLKKLAMIDPLTGLANRRYLDKTIAAKTDEMRRYGLNFGVLFIDIDYFKSINDLYGHLVGDKVLRSVATAMSNVIRSSDILGRWGGEEFVTLVLNVNREQLGIVAEKVRSRIEKMKIQQDTKVISVTVSIGAILADPAGKTDKHSIIKEADELMYKSKSGGRNRVTLKSD